MSVFCDSIHQIYTDLDMPLMSVDLYLSLQSQFEMNVTEKTPQVYGITEKNSVKQLLLDDYYGIIIFHIIILHLYVLNCHLSVTFHTTSNS